MAKAQKTSKSTSSYKVERDSLIKEVMKKHELSSCMQVPAISKITISMGMGQSASDKKELESALKEIELIAGQKPVVTRVRRSEANFKIRQGWPIGVKVTLRRERMHDFLNFLLRITLPAVREFRGFKKKSLDQQGNLSFGIPDQSVFRTIPFDMISTIRGMDICITTSCRDRELSYDVLKHMGFPFKQDKDGES
ncbi:50S ribosomal protein L5 [Gammaproteobacteria bacterium]|nr:50S ribosomal protein L5 [Gammaproteobacteria bacterium]